MHRELQLWVMKEFLSSRSISARIFYHFYPTLKPSFFHFTRSRHTNTRQDKRKHRIGTRKQAWTTLYTRRIPSRRFNSLILLSNPGSPDPRQRSCRTPQPSPLQPTGRSSDVVQPCSGPNRMLSVSRHYEAGRILPDEDRPGYHDPVEDPLPELLPVGPGLRQLRH